MSHWYKLSLLVFLPAAGGGVSDVTGTDAFTLSESAVAQLLPVRTESLTVSDAATGLVLAVASDAATLSESAVTTLANAVGASEPLTCGDSLTALAASATASDSGTLSETGASFADPTGIDSATLSEAHAAHADVVAVDGITLSEVATPTSSSGGAITDSDSFTLSESAGSIPLVAVASDAFTLTDTGAAHGDNTGTDNATLSESATPGADFTGVASYESLSLAPLITVNPSAGQIALAFDSSLVTFDSTLITWDGLYIGELPSQTGVRERQVNDEVGVESLVAGASGVNL